jgi:uncharacterized membrane protein YgcG
VTAVWIALIAVFVVLIPALLVARAKANAHGGRRGDGGFVAYDSGGSGKSKSDSDNGSDGSGDGGGDGGGGGD